MILFLFVIFNSLNAQKFNEITVLESENSFRGQWCCANDGYLYGPGVNQRTSVYRKRETGQGYELRGSVLSIDPTFRIENRMYTTSTPGLIFVLVRNDLNNYFLLKSTDGCLTFTKVFTFGEGNGPAGANAQDVRLLRGILELTTDLPGGGGKGTLLMGEYNVNKARTPGSVNDRVRIMKSTDNGDTWTKVVEWNTNGSNQVGHIHTMKQDPYTGEIYICAGDYDTKTGIIRWDGISVWTDNRSLPSTASMPGFKGFIGLQRYRTCDVLFDENYFYTFADTQAPNNPGGIESGIWRGKKDFSAYSRVDNQIYNYDPMHIGWFGAKIGSTFIFTTAREYMSGPQGSWKELNTQVYISHDGEKWFRTGQINWRETADITESQYITNVYEYNNKLYLDCTAAAGHSATVQCGLSRKWKSYEDPLILHPVFYVGTWNNPGNDNNPGTNPDAPKRTISNILTENRISAASRVRVSAGNFSEPDIHPLWTTPVFQGRGSVVVEGAGMDNTHIIRSTGTTGSYGIMLETTRTLTGSSTPFILKNLDLYITVDGGVDHNNFVLNNFDSYIRTINCRIGNASNDDSPLVNLERAGAKYISEGSIYTASGSASQFKDIIRINNAGTTINMKNCLLLNAWNAISINFPGTDLTLENCTLYNIDNRGVILGAGSTTQPLIENTIFSTGSFPIEDLSGITENAVDYNFYNRATYNVSNGTHGPVVGGSPGFTDPENGNFSLRSNSPCAIGGILLTEVLYDLAGKPRSDPPSIGAYESTGLLVLPETLNIDARSGSKAEFRVNSNTDWTIGGYDSWIDPSVTAGMGSRPVVVTANSTNNSELARSTKLTITGNGADPVYINVTQSGDGLTSQTDTEKVPAVIYPNPVNSVLTIRYNDEEYKSVYITDTKGIILKRLKAENATQQIDFSQFPNGIYVIELMSNLNKPRKFKIIKY
ncbi:MAG TPA: T9SS type A sorting domain-containing protein [Bacteroidales bacterium]|nr:T9SS type A sorting domain-containing protein [Bacteroidales bacterium]